MKPSGWIRLVTVLQLLYALLLISLPIFLLLMAYGWGAVIASAAVGPPGILAFVGWLGLRKGKFWGWSVTLFADLAMFGILAYSTMDYNRIDWDMVGLTAISMALPVLLLLPFVRNFYWGVDTIRADRVIRGELNL